MKKGIIKVILIFAAILIMAGGGCYTYLTRVHSPKAVTFRNQYKVDLTNLVDSMKSWSKSKNEAKELYLTFKDRENVYKSNGLVAPTTCDSLTSLMEVTYQKIQ